MASERHPEHADDLPEYRSISVTAVLGLIVALFSPLALVRTLLIAIPVASALLCLAALAQIRRAEGTLVGRTPAVIGLGLACLFAAATVAQAITWRNTLHSRATPVALAWLEALARQEPHKAHQLTKPDLTRRPLTDALWQFYASDAATRGELEKFVEAPPVRFLLTLGEEARVRLYEPYSVTESPANSQYITQFFAVTYDDPSEGRTTFFLSVTLERREPTRTAREQWRVSDYTPGVIPTRFAY